MCRALFSREQYRILLLIVRFCRTLPSGISNVSNVGREIFVVNTFLQISRLWSSRKNKFGKFNLHVKFLTRGTRAAHPYWSTLRPSEGMHYLTHREACQVYFLKKRFNILTIRTRILHVMQQERIRVRASNCNTTVRCIPGKIQIVYYI